LAKPPTGTQGEPVENCSNKAFSSSFSFDTISQNHVIIWEDAWTPVY